MINFSGWNRGYAFAMYTNERDAVNAINMFNNYMIRPSWYLGVCNSINNCRIFISRIPIETSSEEIVRLLHALTDEVQEVRIRRTLPSSAAIVEYKSHRGAAMARKTLMAAAAAAWGNGARPSVDWSLPLSPQILKQYRELGRLLPDGSVELSHTVEPQASSDYVFGLEPWSQAKRLRMIRRAEREANYSANSGNWSHAQGGPAQHNIWDPQPPAPQPSTSASPPQQQQPPEPRVFNPWTADYPNLSTLDSLFSFNK